MKMETQKEKDAAEYLQKHRIMELLENLNSLLFFYRPGSDPPKLITNQLAGKANAMLLLEIHMTHEAN